MANLKILDTADHIQQLRDAKISFEDAFYKLEQIVSQQESGDMKIQNSIQCFKLAKLLSTYCQEILDNAKLEIEHISKQD